MNLQIKFSNSNEPTNHFLGKVKNCLDSDNVWFFIDLFLAVVS